MSDFNRPGELLASSKRSKGCIALDDSSLQRLKGIEVAGWCSFVVDEWLASGCEYQNSRSVSICPGGFLMRAFTEARVFDLTGGFLTFP